MNTMTTKQRLQFVAEFLNLDMSAMPAWQQLKLNEDTKCFLGCTNDYRWPQIGDLLIQTPTLADEPLSVEEISQLQSELRKMLMLGSTEAWEELETISDSPSLKARVAPGYRAWSLRPEFVGRPTPLTITPILPLVMSYEMECLVLEACPRDAFMLQAVLLLTQQQKAVQGCIRPGCGQWFVRERRQQYCSRRCANLVATHKRRQGLSDKEKEVERSKERETYKRSVLKKTGAKKIGIQKRTQKKEASSGSKRKTKRKA